MATARCAHDSGRALAVGTSMSYVDLLAMMPISKEDCLVVASQSVHKAFMILPAESRKVSPAVVSKLYDSPALVCLDSVGITKPSPARFT